MSAAAAAPLLRPDWPAPAAVGAAMSLRGGGVSCGVYDSLNLSFGVGDDVAAVATNRQRFAAALGAQPVWMRQVHGVAVLRLTAEHAAHQAASALPTADAAWTSERGLACTVGAADCMPVLLALPDGSAVAAAHAGWRGLAGGVIEATVQALCAGTGARAADLLAWTGPCIGPRQFEVGAEVLRAFGLAAPGAEPMVETPGFVRRAAAGPDGQPRWLANLPLLARQRLLALGLSRLSQDPRCTVENASDFFSYRRGGVTGRHAVAIWRV